MRRTKGLVFVLVLAMMVFGLVATASAAGFSDVKADNAAYNDIMKLNALNVVNGYPDGTFQPDKTVTRAEFAKIAVIMAGLKDSADMMKNNASQFSDVKPGQWYTGWVNVAASQGYLKGYPDGTFKPNANVTAAEAITICVRLLGYDDRLPGDWPVDYLAKASKLGITDDLNFVASAPATRGLIAQIASETLDEDMVNYDNDKEDFVAKDPEITLLADAFDDSGLVEEVLVTAVKFDDDGYVMVTYDPEAKDVAKSENEVTLADDVVVAGVPSAFALEGRMVDYIMDDDDEVVFVQLQDDVKAPVFGKVEKGDYDAVKGTLEIDDQKYDLNDEFFVSFSKLFDYGPIENLDDTDFVDGKPLANQIEGYKVTLYFNEDNDVVFIYRTSPDAAMVVDEVDTKNGEIETKTNYVIEDLEEDDDYIILKNGAPIALEDVKEGDVIYDVYNNGGARNFDRYVVIVDTAVEGKFTKFYEDDDEGVIGDKKFTFTDPNGKKGLYLEDSDGDEIDYNDIDDLIGSNVVAKLDGNREVTYVKGATSDGGDMMGVVVDFGTFEGKGSDDHWVEIFTEKGEKVTYDIDEDYWDDEENGEIADVFGSFSTPANYLGKLVEFGLDEDGEIDYIGNPDPDDMKGTYTKGGKAYSVGDPEEDYDRLKVDGDWRYVTDNTKVIDLVYEDGEVDPELASWEDVEDAGNTVLMDVYYDDDEITYIVLWEEGGVTDSDIDGVFLSTYKDGSDLFASFYVDGELKDYEITTGQKSGLVEGVIYTFDVSDGKAKNIEKADYVYDVVTDVNNNNFITKDNGTFRVNDSTMFIVMDGDDIDEVGSYSDLNDDDEVFVLDGDEEDEGIAEIVVILDGYVPDGNNSGGGDNGGGQQPAGTITATVTATASGIGKNLTVDAEGYDNATAWKASKANIGDLVANQVALGQSAVVMFVNAGDTITVTLYDNSGNVVVTKDVTVQ